MARTRTARVLAVIGARGGSKGLLRKNLRPVGGQPLIAWTWAAARAARSVTRLIVSTDDPEIAELSRAAGVEVPFMRPQELASDTASAMSVLIHALTHLPGEAADLVLWLQPTSPLRSAQDIDGAVQLMNEVSAESVVSICPSRHPLTWSKVMAPDGQLLPALPEREMPSRRQDAGIVYELNGAVYVVTREALLAHRSFYPPRTFGYVMPIERSIDVDTAWDLHLADLLLRHPPASDS